MLKYRNNYLHFRVVTCLVSKNNCGNFTIISLTFTKVGTKGMDDSVDYVEELFAFLIF
jgi:hypothetical protein